MSIVELYQSETYQLENDPDLQTAAWAHGDVGAVAHVA